MISVKVSAIWLRREAVPNAQTIGVIVDPDSPDTIQQMKDLTAAATAVGPQLKIVSARSGSDIDAAFATMAEQKVGAVVVTSAPIYFAQREKIGRHRRALRDSHGLFCAPTLPMPAA